MIHFPTASTSEGQASGYLALAEAGQGPGVLVLHAWWGLNDFIKELCDRLAEEGFVALAPDLFDGATADTVAGAEELLTQHDSARIEATVRSAVDYLRHHQAVVGDAIGLVGFSFGAAWALLLATVFQPEDIGAVVVFYGNHPGLGTGEFAQSRAAFLGHFAADDPYEAADDMRQTEAAIQAAGRPVTFHVYPQTGHWFFEADRPDAYRAAAADLAWDRTLAFLRQHLAGKIS